MDGMEKYTIKIDAFEGPFDLLFHLIEKNKIDIYDIPISLITDQYLDYIERMHEMDLDVASEFLVMASTLLHIKSRMLLPAAQSDREEDAAKDPRDELVVNMIEYKKYKDLSSKFRENSRYWQDAYYRPADAAGADAESAAYAGTRQLSFLDMDKNRLFAVYRGLVEANRRRHDNVEDRVNKIIKREQITLSLKIIEIINYLAERPGFIFQKIYNTAVATKLSVITAFIALLELSQQNRLTLRQKELFGALRVSLRERKTS